MRLVFFRDQRPTQFKENQLLAHVAWISVIIVCIAPALTSALTTLSELSDVTRATILPPRPAPESFAPSAPAAPAASTRPSSSGDDTLILRKRAWFSFIKTPRES